MNFGNFGNTNCYRYLTSQVLAASRCGNYYGPDLFTNKNQPTFNKYQAQQERIRVKQQQAEQDYLCPSNYSAFINSINSNVMPDAANQAIRLNQQMGLQQLGRNNVPCRTDCNEITDSLWSAAKKSSIYVPDTATTWYECQREQNMGGNLSEKCKMFGISSRESYQPHQHLQLARPIRDGEQRLMDPKSFKHISPEFLSLLEEHEQAMLARNPLYGVDTKSERAPFCDVPRERLQKRHKSYSTTTATTATTDKRTSRPQRQSRAKSRSRQDERRGLIQTISDTCFSDSPKTTKNRNSSLRQRKYNERMAGGEDGEFSKKKNFNETSRIKIRSNIKADLCSGGIFQPKENYELAVALSSGYRPKAGVSLCGNMLKAEYRRATAELTKKVQRKESVISKRKSREEKAAEMHKMHKKCEDKENNRQRSEIKDNSRLTVRKDLFGQTTVDKQQHEIKQTKEGNKLELIWHKRDITRMRDSEISLQMANMRRYAETESRDIVQGKTKLGCEELERLKDIDMQRELTQMTYFRAKAGRDISQSDAVDRKVTIDFSSEVDDLAQISTEMKKLKISEWSLNTFLRVGSKFSHETTEQQKLSHTEAELDNCQAEEQAPVVGHVKDLKSRKNKKEVFAASIEPRDSLEHIGLVKKRRNTLKGFHAQRKKLKRVRENVVDVKEIETKQRNYSKKLHTSLSKLCDENRVCEKRSVHSYSSARSIQPCTNLPIKPKTKSKLNARVKVPKSTCKHYRNKNVPPRRRKAWRKYRANSSLCHAGLYKLSAQNSLELLRQRQKSKKRLLVQTATSSCAKFNESLNSRALPKSEFSSCTAVSKTSLNHMADDVPSTSKATVKSRAVVQDFKSTYSTSDNETRCEPSTSSLEEMLVHIKTQLKLRHNKKHGSSDKTTNSCTQKIRLQQQNAKVAGKSSKVKGRSASRKQINKPRKRHKHRPLVDSIRIPLVRNNAFILGQQNRSIEIAYATGSHSLNIKSVENITPPATQPNSRRRRKLKKKPSNGVQESEA